MKRTFICFNKVLKFHKNACYQKPSGNNRDRLDLHRKTKIAFQSLGLKNPFQFQR